MRLILAAVCLLALLCVVDSRPLSEREYQQLFVSYVGRFNKQYQHDEFFSRYNIFKANYDQIHAHNAGNHSWTMAINEFADMTTSEFKKMKTGYRPLSNPYLRSQNVADLSGIVPALAVDWRSENAVTPVKNQQQCGSCWAFSSTGSLEGAWAIKTGNLISLSEQQLVDCSTAQGNQGCNGGLMDQAFEYVIANGGIGTEASYPYTAADGTCQTVPSVVKISSYKDVPTLDEASLLKAANIGPVSIAIEADQTQFQFYSGGVFDSSCGTNLDHGVLIAGYGTDAGKDYWLVKNSWGASWGESGYIRMVRNKNECGLAIDPSYPIV